MPALVCPARIGLLFSNVRDQQEVTRPLKAQITVSFFFARLRAAHAQPGEESVSVLTSPVRQDELPPLVVPPPARDRARGGWAPAYRGRLVTTDVACVTWAVAVAELTLFGTHEAVLQSRFSPIRHGFVVRTHHRLGSSPCTCSAVGTHATWARVLTSTRAWPGVPSHFRRGGHPLLAAQGRRRARPSGISLGMGLVSLMVTRWLWRRWLVPRRLQGRFTSSVLVVGSHQATMRMATLFELDPHAQFQVVGVCAPGWVGAKG